MHSNIKITMDQWINSQQHLTKESIKSLCLLLNSIQSAAKIISKTINQSPIHQLLGNIGYINSHNEEVKKLDIYANNVWKQHLQSSQQVSVFCSEEDNDATFIKDVNGQYVVAFDPLDGSSNIDANVSVGSIFGIWPKKLGKQNPDVYDILRPGKELIAAGYILYSSSTMFVITLGQGVAIFTLDCNSNDFILTHTNINVQSKGNIYSINEGNSIYWDPSIRNFIDAIKSEKPYSLRYIGSMVADVHRTLLYGGIFMYPADTKSPKGKLRYLYEVAPLSYIIEQAGGKSTNGFKSCLEITPVSLHDKIPVFLGGDHEISNLEKFFH